MGRSRVETHGTLTFYSINISTAYFFKLSICYMYNLRKHDMIYKRLIFFFRVVIIMKILSQLLQRKLRALFKNLRNRRFFLCSYLMWALMISLYNKAATRPTDFVQKKIQTSWVFLLSIQEISLHIFL